MKDYPACKELPIAQQHVHVCKLILNSIITFWRLLKYHVIENIIENGACAPLEQMLHYPLDFQNYSNLYFFLSKNRK